MKPVKYKDLPSGKLFRICAERRPYYVQGERKVGMVRSKDFTVYKKNGDAFASSKAGKDIILVGDDLVFEYTGRKENTR